MATVRAIIQYSAGNGFEIVEEDAATPGQFSAPKRDDIRPARWAHWYQRQLARVWYAVMLSMNLEPTILARRALQAFEPLRYDEYKDRLGIASTLAGWENLPVYEEHAKEGERASERYVSLVDFYEFAKPLGWSDLDAMRTGLKIGSKPPVLPGVSPKERSSLLLLLHELLRDQVKDFDANRHYASAALVASHFIEHGLSLSVEAPTLAKYIQAMPQLGEDLKVRRANALRKADPTKHEELGDE